jgi:hypothetical protein
MVVFAFIIVLYGVLEEWKITNYVLGLWCLTPLSTIFQSLLIIIICFGTVPFNWYVD